MTLEQKPEDGAGSYADMWGDSLQAKLTASAQLEGEHALAVL